MTQSLNSKKYYDKVREKMIAAANVTEVHVRKVPPAQIEIMLRVQYGRKLEPVRMALSKRKHRIKSNFDDMPANLWKEV